MFRIRQNFNPTRVANVPQRVLQQLDQCSLPQSLAGRRIAVAVGSRGITDIVSILTVTVEWLKKHGAVPFIVPAMGSHGGATAAGQAQVLAELGITEFRVGVPIVSSAELIEIGSLGPSIPVFIDKQAHEADGILVVNRVKPHTQFRSDIESGLLKLLAIGLGKERSASTVHAHGVSGLKELIPKAAQLIISTGKVLAGLAVVENAYGQTAELRALVPSEMELEEKKLLRKAKELMPSLPVERLDFLILDEIGKDISGPGMDSSVTGRIMAHGVPDPDKPDIKIIAALDLTAASAGNAVGIGLADLTTARLVSKIDMKATYINSILGGFPEQGKIPMFFQTDRELLDAAAQLIGATPFDQARIIRAKNTLLLDELLVSEFLLDEVRQIQQVQIQPEPEDILFDSDGLLMPFLFSSAKASSSPTAPGLAEL
jgi:hypothetical protein